jgi:hypothetical protein
MASTLGLNAMNCIVGKKSSSACQALLVSQLPDDETIVKFAILDDRYHLFFSAFRARKRLRCLYFSLMK